MSALTSPAHEFLVWCADDYTEAYVLRDVLRRLDACASAEEERGKDLATLAELILAGLLRVGDMVTTAPGLQYWEGSPPEILARLTDAWTLEVPPEMGHGPWFYATEAGKAAVR